MWICIPCGAVNNDRNDCCMTCGEEFHPVNLVEDP